MAATRRGLISRLTAEQRGFTLIELTVTMALVAVGLIALVGSLDHSRELVNMSEKIETATHQGELELERVLAIEYSKLALNAAPTPSGDTSNPDYYASSGPPPRYQWDQGSTGPQTADLVIDAANGLISPSKITWQDTDSRLTGYLHRYVTWTGDMCSSCPGVQQAKRITVAVAVNGPEAPRRPVLISAIKVNPDSVG
jgi:prepilin-type N-terminal cleavage/methylation domain-containing protein